MPVGMLIAIGCSNALPDGRPQSVSESDEPASIEERLAKLESQHPTPEPPPPPMLELQGTVSAEVAKGGQNTLSSLTVQVSALRPPSVNLIKYTESHQTTKFDSASDFTVSKLDAGGYEIRMEGLLIGTNTTFSLEVMQQEEDGSLRAPVLFIRRTTPAEFTTEVVNLD